MHAMISSLFLVVLTLTTITAQCPPQTTITNTTQAIPSGQQQITRSLFINHTIAEQPDSGLIKDAIISTVGNNVTCTNIVLLGLRLEFGDGISWGTVADFVINSASIAAVTTAYDNAVKLPLPNTITPAFRSKFPATGNSSLNVINTSALSSFLINSVAVKNRDQGIQVIQPNGQDNQNRTGIAAQPCQVSQWSNCDGCKSDKNQIVTRQVLVPAVGGGSCPPTQMRVYCDRKCLTDWQIGLISLACFLFLVAVCLCFYCVCIRNRRDDTAAHQRAQQKEKELAMAPVTTKKPADEEKIDVEVPDPVRPSTQLDEPAFHRASADTVNTVTTGPRPTATFHDDDDTAQPTPVDEAKEDEPVPAPAAAPPAGAPRANVVRVHL